MLLNKIKLFAGVALLTCLCSCAQVYKCTVENGEIYPGVAEHTFNNGIIEVKVASGVSGIVNGFEYLPEKFQLFEKMIYKVKRYDLLPEKISVKVTGGRELVWGVKKFVNVKMNVDNINVTDEAAVIDLSADFFQGENLYAQKRVAVQAGKAAVDVEFTITNKGRKTQNMSLWKHLTAQLTPGAMDVVLLPAAGGVKRVGKRAVLPMVDDVIYHDTNIVHKQFYTKPFLPWMGRAASGDVNDKGVLVMYAPQMLEQGALFYTWKAGVSPLHTTEMIFVPEDIASGASKKYSIRYLYFSKLRYLRNICGDYGFDLADGALVVESVSAQAARNFSLWKKSGKDLKKVGNYVLPELESGGVHKIKLPDPACAGEKSSLVIRWENGSETILPAAEMSGKTAEK